MLRENITDIICIGCQKGSTSWLHSALNRHPDTYAFPDHEPQTSTCKEAHFWDRNHELGVDWYRTLMTPADPALKSMDFTPEYAFLPDRHIAECKRLNPTAKVIYILRDPTARVVSSLRMHLLWRFGNGADVRIEMNDLLHDTMRRASLDEHGSYVRNYEAWKKHYPDMLVLNYEEMHTDRDAFMAKVMDYVGIDPGRLTDEHRKRYDDVMDRKVWESERFPVDREVLVYLNGFTKRTRIAVRNVLGIEFTEGQRMINEAPARSAPSGGGDMNALLPALEQIRAELVRSREVAVEQRKLLEDLRGEMQGQRRLVRLILNKTTAGMDDDITTTLAKVQMNMAETLDAIHDRRLSLARFGDGELMQMVTPDHHIHFQRNSPALQHELTQALNPDWISRGRVLVALPPPFRGHLHWLGAWIMMWPTLKRLIDPTVRYGNSLITRPMFFQSEGAAGVAQWRRLWQGREVLVVTGKGSRFDLLPALFDGAGRIEFLHAAPIHAFEERETILKGVIERANADTLVLLSLGPTAAILTHRIAAQGIQALDIGHLSASYSHVFEQGQIPEKMPARR